MAYKVVYANNNLHDYITILNVERTVMPPRTNFTKDIPGIDGEFYTGYKYTPKKISLECVLFAESKEEFVDNLNQLAFLLDTKAPSKMIIDDAPNKYQYAVLDGEISIDKIKHNGQFTLEFICYDPFCYSVEDDLYSMDSDKYVRISNDGSASAFPKVDVSFSKDAFFLSCSVGNKVILVGQPNSVDDVVAPPNPVVLNDKCETLEGWNPIGNIVDNAIVDGSLSINEGGYAIYCNNFGSGEENQWHGGGARKNLTRSLTDFQVKIDFEHNSKGDLKGVGSTSNPPVSSGQYKVTADPSLRIRKGRGTNFDKVGSIPKGKIITISNIQSNWGQTTYGGVTGYVSMEFVEKYNAPTSQNGTYKITADPSLRVRSGRGTNYKILTKIPKGKTVSVSDISGGWGKVTYSSKTGYISMQHTSKVNTSRAASTETETDPSAENKIGQLQVLGFDANGTRLFCAKMIDAEKWFEYSEPMMYIGGKLVLDDNKKCPTPTQKENKDDDGKVIGKEDTDSGAFGDWNCTTGKFIITRKTVNGVQQWNCEVQKLGSGGVVAKRLPTNTLTNNLYPKGDLANIVVFFGQYGKEPVVDTMVVSNITVTDLGSQPKPEVKQPIFSKGKRLLIDVASQKVYYDGELFMNNLDIGSEFFTLPTGSSRMLIKSDDTNVDVEVGVKKRWL
ncbi:MAG: phage tail family protein [Bacilli bacterium]|uniref:distal tail protein Dit n=1 Tax=Clostridium sp. TaxID=1506 RepID=UPI002FCA9D5E